MIEPKMKRVMDACPCDLGDKVKHGKDKKFDSLCHKMGTEGVNVDEFTGFLYRLNEQDPTKGSKRPQKK